jgi:hypothetical protein
VPTNFPTALDTFPSAATLASHTLQSDPHSTLHGNLGDALAALEAKVGVDGSSVPSSLDFLLSLKAALASPTFTGTPSAPTAALGTNTTQLATTAFVLANAPALPPDVARTGVANTFTTGVQTIQTGADGNKGLVVQGHSATQGANLQEWQDSFGGLLSYVRNDGTVSVPAITAVNIYIVGGPSLNTLGVAVPSGSEFYWPGTDLTDEGVKGRLRLLGFGSAVNTQFIVRAVPAQPGNLQEWQDSNGNPLLAVDPNGHVVWHGQSSTSTDRVLATVAGSFVVSTDATFTTRLSLSAQDYGGIREGLRIEGSGSAALLGFFGAGAAAKPTVTGSRGGNAALQSFLSALASLGLITDSTSP